MAPIIAPNASSDEDLDIDINGIFASKEKLGGHDFNGSILVATDGRDDEGDDAQPQPEEDGDHAITLNPQTDDLNDEGRESSNLFADESSIQASYLGLGNDKHFHVKPLPQCATDVPLSLMQSFSPSPSSCSSGGGGLEDVDISSTQLFDVDEFAVSILSQIDADEELARQLQDEENKKKQQQTPKPKAKVRPSMVESFLGEPFPMEIKSNYTKVSDGSSGSSGGDFSDSVSGSISMLTTSFKKWGSGITSAATDFFGEDIGLQKGGAVRIPTSRGGSRNQYRNAV